MKNDADAEGRPMEVNGSQSVAEDYIDLVKVAEAVLARWLLIVTCIIVGMALSAGYALTLPNTFRAETVLAPAEVEEGNSSISNSLGGAAALLGVSLGSSSDTSVRHALAVLTSRDFLGRFIATHEIKPALFAGIWNADTGSSALDVSIYDETSDIWMREAGEPSALEAYRELRRLLLVSGPDRETGLIYVAIDWIDPMQARDWTNWLVSDLNAELRADDVAEATEAIAYLRRQLESTSLVEMQRVFYQLIESQTRITMLADVRDEYVLRVIDPAVMPDQKSGPARTLFVLAGALLGLAFALVFMALTYRRSNARRVGVQNNG